jgi:hypothetical protein
MLLRTAVIQKYELKNKKIAAFILMIMLVTMLTNEEQFKLYAQFCY